MGKERSDGGVAALWMEKQIWEQTDAEEEQAKHIYRSTYNAGRNKVLGGVEENSEEARIEVR